MSRNNSARVVHSIRQSVLKVTGCAWVSIYLSIGRVQTEDLTSCSVAWSRCSAECVRWWRARLLVFIRTQFRCTWMKYQSTSGRRTKRHLSCDPKRPPLRPAILTAAKLEYSSVTSLTHKIPNQYRPGRESLTNKRLANQNDVQHPCKIG